MLKMTFQVLMAVVMTILKTYDGFTVEDVFPTESSKLGWNDNSDRLTKCQPYRVK